MKPWALIIAGLAAWIWAAPGAALEAEWRDLHSRCAAAVLAGARLDVQGLEDRLPNFQFDITEDENFGSRIDIDPLGTPGGRTIPTGVWGAQEGRLEMWLIEYPTRVGFRAICEVRPGRGAATVTLPEAMLLQDVFVETAEQAGLSAIKVSNPGLRAFRFAQSNPRGCSVVSSMSAKSGRLDLRSSVSELAGAPNCGGPSLASRVITPHGMQPGCDFDPGGNKVKAVWHRPMTRKADAVETVPAMGGAHA